MIYNVLLSGIFLLTNTIANAQNPRVYVSFEADPGLRAKVETAATAIVQSINRTAATGAFVIDRSFFAPDDNYAGFEELKSLAEITGMKCVEEVYTRDMYEIPGGLFEIRDIVVVTKPPKSTDAAVQATRTYDANRDLNLIFNRRGQLVAARFAIEKTRYMAMLSQSEDLDDLFKRKQILNYVEKFRTAYNNKDLPYIASQFDENALIITGVRVKKAEEPNPVNPENSKEAFKLIRHDKATYLKNLERIFKNNAYIDIKYEDISIRRHQKYKEVYGVNLFQIYNSDRYSDKGYLFLLIDFEPENPVIYVRAWQEDSFITTGGKVIDLSMFDFVK
jgi:hypothetical protein